MERGRGAAGLIAAVLLLARPETVDETMGRELNGQTFLTIPVNRPRAPRPDPPAWAGRMGHRLDALFEAIESLKVACGKGIVGASNR